MMRLARGAPGRVRAVSGPDTAVLDVQGAASWGRETRV
jgi:hypothetical protein